MSEREELIVAMARTSCNDFDIDWDREVEDRWLHYARVALDAIEAAGWRLVPPEEEDKT